MLTVRRTGPPPRVVALGVPMNGGVAFPLPWGLKSAFTTGLVVGVEGEIPKDAFTLFLKGNEFGQSYDISDWDGSGWGLVSLNFAAAKPWLPKQLKPYLREFSLGGTLKITGGAYGEVVESGGTGFTSELQGADLDVFVVAQNGGGVGFGLDFGAAGVTKDGKTTVSLGVLNLLDVMSWSIDSRRDRVFASASNLRVTRLLDEDVKGIEDILDNPDVDGDGDTDFNEKISEDSFDRSVPAMIRLGAAHRLMPRLTLVGNYDQAFSSGFGITTHRACRLAPSTGWCRGFRPAEGSPPAAAAVVCRSASLSDLSAFTTCSWSCSIPPS